MKLRVAGFQMEVSNNIEKNKRKIIKAIQQASSSKADILLTPEGALSGYTHDFNAEEVSSALHEVTSLACDHHLGLALGTCFQEPNELIYNQLRFYSPDGRYLGFHSKILRCGSLTDSTEGEISQFSVTPLQTFSFGGLTIGGLICNDMWANPGCTPMPDPFLSQQLANMGARVIFHAVNGGRNGGEWSQDVVWPYHESNLRMRTQAGNVWVVTVDNSNPATKPCSAPCGVIDPQGNWVYRTQPQGEQFFIHTIEIPDTGLN